MSKKDLRVFKYNGTDMYVPNHVFNALTKLTKERDDLKMVESKLKVMEAEKLVIKKQYETSQAKVDSLKEHLDGALETLREMKQQAIQEKIDNMDPKELFETFAGAVEEFRKTI